MKRTAFEIHFIFNKPLRYIGSFENTLIKFFTINLLILLDKFKHAILSSCI